MEPVCNSQPALLATNGTDKALNFTSMMESHLYVASSGLPQVPVVDRFDWI